LIIMAPEVLRGTLNPDGTLYLRGVSRLPAGEVEVTIRPAEVTPEELDEDWWGYLQRARAAAEAEGTACRDAEEIEAERRAFRAE
jgi:hypothetical protein